MTATDHRLEAVRSRMRELDVDLVALGPTENMTYLLGFHPHPDERLCLLLIGRDDVAMLMPELNAEESRQHTAMPMETWPDGAGPSEALARVAARLRFGALRSVALDETMRTDFTLELLASMPQARASVAADIVGALRMRKDAAEIDAIAANAGIADEAMTAAFGSVRAGVTERDVAGAARAAFEARSVDRVNFAIIGSGPNGAFPHHHTGGRVLSEGDAVVMDIGARKEDYNSDITRMAFVGEPPADYLAVHDVVERAVQAALAAVRPGARAMDVDGAARDVIAAAGYGAYFVHRTGHGLGLTGHEPPYITGTNAFVLEQGMVFSIEPGIYLQDRFGIRLEEIVTVTDSGARVFSRLPRDPHVVRS